LVYKTNPEDNSPETRNRGNSPSDDGDIHSSPKPNKKKGLFSEIYYLSEIDMENFKVSFDGRKFSQIKRKPKEHPQKSWAVKIEDHYPHVIDILKIEDQFNFMVNKYKEVTSQDMLEKINTIASRNGRMEFQRGIVYNKESFGIHAETIYPWDKIDIKNIVEIGLFSPRQKQEMALWHFLTSTKLTQKEISNKIGLSQSTISQSIAYTKKNGNIKSF
jgi:hypothetical protein